MYKIALFGKLREFKDQNEFNVKTVKKVSAKKLKRLILASLCNRNPGLTREIEPIIRVSAISDNERILDKDEIVSPGVISLLPPVSGG